MELAKKYLPYILSFFVGFFVCYKFFPNEKIVEVPKTIKQVVQGEVKTETKTELVYVPKTIYIDSNGKEVQEKTDLNLNLGKQELNVKINGKDAVIKKEETEQYIFDKNKLELNQTSKSDISITVPTIDNTKHWGVGVGYGNNGIGYTVDFPINKKANLDGWLYKDNDTNLIGVKVKF